MLYFNVVLLNLQNCGLYQSIFEMILYTIMILFERSVLALLLEFDFTVDLTKQGQI